MDNTVREIMAVVMAVATVVITIMSFLICMPRRFPKPVIIISFIVLAAGLLLLNTVTDHIRKLPVPNGWPFIPLVIIFFKGNIFQKLFLLFANFFISISIIILFSMTFGFFVQYGSAQIFLLMIAAISVTFTVYIILMLKFGKQLLEKIFGSGSKKEWALYMISIFILYYFQFLLQRVHVQNNVFYFAAQIFLIWSFLILCYAIINTYEKTKQKYKADFARDIIAAGLEHYQRMNEQYEAIRIMKHDIKFHINTALDMLQNGEIEKGGQYLTGLKNQIAEKELPVYCNNQVINSLVADYARKCRDNDIELDISITIPENFFVHNYEMCIVLGNLMENALEACQKLGKEREIKLVIKPKGEQLALMVRNTYNGRVVKAGDKYQSEKQVGGVGLESVMAVVQSYGETLHIEHDGVWFSVFVLWK